MGQSGQLFQSPRCTTYLCMESTRSRGSVRGAGGGEQEKADELATLLLSNDLNHLAGSIEGLASLLEQSELADRKRIAAQWRELVSHQGFDFSAARFIILMALIDPALAPFVEYLRTKGDRDRVDCFQRFVVLESTLLFAGTTRDHQPCTHVVATGEVGERVRAYPSMQVFVLQMCATYGSEWDPGGYRAHRREQAEYDVQMRDA